MKSKINKFKIILSIVIIALLISNCNNKTNLGNQITIKINSIDKVSKQRRVNTFDTVIVRKEGIGYLTKTFHPTGKYITDSTGSVKVKIDSTKILDISIVGLNVFGGDMYYPGHLKDGEEINIEVITFTK